jgi:hypothetical protein
MRNDGLVENNLGIRHGCVDVRRMSTLPARCSPSPKGEGRDGGMISCPARADV